MNYEITYEDAALKAIKRIKKSGNKPLINKLTDLLAEIIEHPRTGTGQPEQLKHYAYKQTWSRRLNQDYRLVYEIHDDVVMVKVVSADRHYGDK